jgi:S-formylglutathione hydrolase FrmB
VKFRSAAIGRTERVAVIVPEGGGKRPLLIFLHGKGGDENGHLQDEMFDALDALGDRAPVVAFPDGGGGSYWHDRSSGAWERMVRRELPRRLARRVRFDRSRIAVGGISMGGFGALSLARSGDYCAAGAHSPAIWRSGAETAPGAFDDAADFARHDVIAHAGDLAGTRLWVDIGDRDPFLSGTRAFGRAAGVKVRVWRGGHDGSYWRAHYDEYLRFYADALAECA